MTKDEAPTRGVDRTLLDRWKRADELFAGFLDSLGASEGAHTVAVWFTPQKVSSPKQFAKLLEREVAGDSTWNVATTLDEAGNRLGYALPVTETRSVDALNFLFVETHTTLVAWWMVCAWRARQLAAAAGSLADGWNTVAAASCVRPLVETAAATWVDARKIALAWDDMKRDGNPTGQKDFFKKFNTLQKLLAEVHFGGKFDERAPSEKEMWGRVQRANVLGQIEKLAKAGCPTIQSDYQWLCNTVHPSLGNMFAFSAPPFGHKSGTHITKWYCGRPIAIQRADGTEVSDPTVQVATARAATSALRVLHVTLDAALRVVDDVGLSTGAPSLWRESYWRQLRRPSPESLCPCRSGKKAQDCRHAMGDSGPAIPDVFRDTDIEIMTTIN